MSKKETQTNSNNDDFGNESDDNNQAEDDEVASTVAFDNNNFTAIALETTENETLPSIIHHVDLKPLKIPPLKRGGRHYSNDGTIKKFSCRQEGCFYSTDSVRAFNLFYKCVLIYFCFYRKVILIDTRKYIPARNHLRARFLAALTTAPG